MSTPVCIALRAICPEISSTIENFLERLQICPVTASYRRAPTAAHLPLPGDRGWGLDVTDICHRVLPYLPLPGDRGWGLDVTDICHSYRTCPYRVIGGGVGRNGYIQQGPTAAHLSLPGDRGWGFGRNGYIQQGPTAAYLPLPGDRGWGLDVTDISSRDLPPRRCPYRVIGGGGWT